MKKPEILLIGTGGIGGFYGGKLAASGIDVSVVCRSDYEVVKKNGIQIHSVDGDFHFSPRQVITKVSDYEGRPDFILVATKALPEINLYELLKERVYPETTIVLLQNGIEIEAPLAGCFPDNEIISAILYIGSTRIKPGQIDHKALGELSIGTYPGGISEKCQQLADLFNKARVKCTAMEDVIGMRWKKLTWNAPFNTLPVICQGYSVYEMANDNECISLVKNVTREIMVLAEKSGYSLQEDLADFNIQICRKLEGYKPSMQIDFENRRPMEVDAILGNAVSLAKKYGIQVPHLNTLYTLLSTIDKQIRNSK